MCAGHYRHHLLAVSLQVGCSNVGLPQTAALRRSLPPGSFPAGLSQALGSEISSLYHPGSDHGVGDPEMFPKRGRDAQTFRDLGLMNTPSREFSDGPSLP